MNDEQRPYFFAIPAILFWSTIASAFALALRGLAVSELLFGSSFVAFICLGVILAIQRKLGFYKRLKQGDFFRSAIMGFLNPFLYYLVLLHAYSIIPAQEAMVLNYIWPITLVVFSALFLKQKIRMWSYLCIFISFIGVVIIATRGNLLSLTFNNPFGDFLALSSSIAWALFWVINLKDSREESEKMFLNFAFGLLYSAVFYFISTPVKWPSNESIWALVYIGLFEMGITFVLWLKALRLAKSTDKISQLVFLSPFLSLLFINLFVGEKINTSTFVGLIFIIGGIFLQKSIKIKKKLPRNI